MAFLARTIRASTLYDGYEIYKIRSPDWGAWYGQLGSGPDSHASPIPEQEHAEGKAMQGAGRPRAWPLPVRQSFREFIKTGTDRALGLYYVERKNYQYHVEAYATVALTHVGINILAIIEVARKLLISWF